MQLEKLTLIWSTLAPTALARGWKSASMVRKSTLLRDTSVLEWDRGCQGRCPQEMVEVAHQELDSKFGLSAGRLQG